MCPIPKNHWSRRDQWAFSGFFLGSTLPLHAIICLFGMTCWTDVRMVQPSKKNQPQTHSPKYNKHPTRLASTLRRSMNNGSERWFFTVGRLIWWMIFPAMDLGALERHGVPERITLEVQIGYIFLKCFFPKCAFYGTRLHMYLHENPSIFSAIHSCRANIPVQWSIMGLKCFFPHPKTAWIWK